ncbi:MAG: hypothetical protein L3J76_06095, partial [Candidatus Hydrothermae bacterium]|nr:hypothetical protein [Candidatus Hydrothermae bacterium]
QDTLPWKGEQRKVQIRGVQTLGAGHGSLGLIVLDSTRLDTSLFYWWRTGLQLSASRPGRLSLEPALLVARNMISNIPHPFWSVRADITFNLYAFVLVRLHLWDEVSGTQFHYRGAECTLGTTLRGIDGQVRYWLQEDLLFQTYRAELHATLGMHF